MTSWHALRGHWIHSWLHVQEWSLNKDKTDVNVFGASHETDKSMHTLNSNLPPGNKQSLSLVESSEGCSDHIQHLSHWFSHTDTNPRAIFQIQQRSLPVSLAESWVFAAAYNQHLSSPAQSACQPFGVYQTRLSFSLCLNIMTLPQRSWQSFCVSSDSLYWVFCCISFSCLATDQSKSFEEILQALFPATDTSSLMGGASWGQKCALLHCTRYQLFISKICGKAEIWKWSLTQSSILAVNLHLHNKWG